MACGPAETSPGPDDAGNPPGRESPIFPRRSAALWPWTLSSSIVHSKSGKRQAAGATPCAGSDSDRTCVLPYGASFLVFLITFRPDVGASKPVSYTHLTLPTIL